MVEAASAAEAAGAVAASDSAGAPGHPSPATTSPVDVLGVRVDPVGWDEVERRIATSLASGEEQLLHIATVNPEYVMAARRDPGFAAALAAADLRVVDGAGVELAIRLSAGNGVVPPRVTGIDLVPFIAARSRRWGAPLFLLGGAPGAALETADRLRLQQRAEVAGWWDGGSPDARFDRETVDRIRSSRARIVLVAYGAPGQVTWIERNRAALSAAGIRVAVGVGGAFDMLSGRVRRAPVAIQRLRLEWLWRLGQEPWRWRRQAVLPHYLALVAWERLRRPAGRG